eukprot:5152754-Pyramimonas_sp.AAC.1
MREKRKQRGRKPSRLSLMAGRTRGSGGGLERVWKGSRGGRMHAMLSLMVGCTRGSRRGLEEVKGGSGGDLSIKSRRP